MSGEIEVNEEGSNNNDEDIATFITERWIELDQLKAGAKRIWKEIAAYKYATDTTNPIMGINSFDHTTHIPVVAPIAQDLEAILTQVIFPHDDWFGFSAQDSDSATPEKIGKVKAFLKNRHKVQKFPKVAKKWIADLIDTGNCFGIVDFVDETKGPNTKGYIGPKPGRISPNDIVFDPTADSFEDTAKIIRQLVSIGKVAQWAKKGLIDKEIVKDLINRRNTSSRATFTQEEKDQQYTPAGFSNYESYMTSGVIEVIWFYGDFYNPVTGDLQLARKIGVVDTDRVIMNEAIDTTTGKPHIYHAGWQVRSDNLWHMGPLDNIIGLNHQINHRENGKNDALDKLINPDKVHLGDVEEIYDEETGQSTYLAPEGGGVQELAVNTQFFQYDLQIQNLEQTARTAARLPLDLVGFRSPGEKTLGEVSALTDGAMRGFIHKARDFEQFIEQILEAELELSANNLASVIQVPGQVQDGFVPFLDIAQEDLKVTGSLTALGALRFSRKNQILRQFTQLQQSGLLALVQPHLSTKELSREVARLVEVQDSNIFEDYVALVEQGEAQKFSQDLARNVASETNEESIEESIINEELNPQQEGDVDGSN